MNPSLMQAVEWGRQTLANSASADVDARALLCFVLDCSATYLHTWSDKILTEQQWQQFQQLVDARSEGIPVAHLTGTRGFWTLDLAVNDSTLIPRPDTELLVSIALQKLGKGMRVIDLGTGTGAIILALAAERPELHFFASDYSIHALKLAQRNALRHHLSNVSFIQTSWLQAFKSEQFDFIISNPPYIRADDPHLQQGDVCYEPLSALVAGEDGLVDIRQIIAQARQCLKKDGWLLIEHGYDQGDSVMRLFDEAGFDNIELHQDYGGQDRAVVGQLTL